MKILIVALVMVSSAAQAFDREDAVGMMRSSLMNGITETKCLPFRTIAFRFNYQPVKKWDKTHIEMRGEVNEVEFHGVLELSKATGDGKTDLNKATFHHNGTKDSEMSNGLTDKVDQWKECEK